MEARRLEDEHENYHFNRIFDRTRLAFSVAFIVDYEKEKCGQAYIELFVTIYY
jgi:hypothetical protein